MQSAAYANDRHGTRNPIDLVERVATGKDWSCERRSVEEVAVEVPGRWCDYGLYFAWSEELGALHFSCAFDMRIDAQRQAQVYELLAHLNERLWLGHFAIWMDEGIPMFRHTVQVTDLAAARLVLEDLIAIAVAECERFYPAFQFVIWGGKSARDAIQAAMLDVMGEA